MTKASPPGIFRVDWSQRSRRDSIPSRPTSSSTPLAAARLADALIVTAESLATHPHRGRVLYGAVRELVVVRPYLIRYRVLTDAVQIMRIKHGVQAR